MSILILTCYNLVEMSALFHIHIIFSLENLFKKKKKEKESKRKTGS